MPSCCSFSSSAFFPHRIGFKFHNSSNHIEMYLLCASFHVWRGTCHCDNEKRFFLQGIEILSIWVFCIFFLEVIDNSNDFYWLKCFLALYYLVSGVLESSTIPCVCVCVGIKK